MRAEGRRAKSAAVIVFLAFAACASAAPAPVALVSAPHRATVGKPIVVVVRSAAPRVVIWIKRGTSVRAFPARRTGRLHRASLLFPAEGTWTIGARAGASSRSLARVDVAARPVPAFTVTEPFGIAALGDGALLVADGRANRLLRVSGTNVTSFAGDGSASAPAAGRDARTSSIGRPLDLCVGPGGDVYFISGEKVWRIDHTTFAIAHVAGTVDGHAGDGGPAGQAQLRGPTRLDVEPSGNLLIAEYGGYVRRIDAATGTISTIAGIGRDASSGDGGPATGAAIDRPHGVAVGPAGKIFVADSYGNAVRAISGDGSIATVSPAHLPTGLVAAADGTLYIAETQGNAVLRIGADGRTTALGTVVQPTDVALAGDRVYAVYLGSSPGSGGVASFAR